MPENKTLREQIEKIVWKHYQDGHTLNVEEILDEVIPLVEAESERVREKTIAEVESALEDYFLGTYPIPDHKVIGGYLREALLSNPNGNE